MAASWCRRSYLFKTFGIKLRLSPYRHFHVLSYTLYKDKNIHGTRQRVPDCLLYSDWSKIKKKDVSHPMEKTHDPNIVEQGWYDWWTSRGFFTPSAEVSGDEDKFVILFPPPNVTGTLHLGHALTSSIQDALVRWHRMNGKTTLWIPGTDHAGIATHAVVEKKIWQRDRKTRHDLGKEKFVQEIWDFKEINEKEISHQVRRLGCSLDWSREYFTMNQPLSRAVTEAFCRLYESGLIYQAKRLVNWSCAFRSSVSDVEVDKVKFDGRTVLSVPGEPEGVCVGTISSFAYPVADSDETVVVSTTRLETMLADTAVAVHPEDPRYGHLVGKQLQHPLDKGRLLPVIADSFVDMDFAHGAVKITPGHDQIDFEVGQRHNLATMEILNDDGTMNRDVPLVGGLSRFQAREKVREALIGLGLFLGERDHATVLPLCSRSGDIIEPRMKTQWFLNCQGMAEKALEAVEEGRLRLIPDYNRKVWSEWLSDVQDWCLSRQLWWGHRIPVYTCKTSGKTVCARTEDEAKERLASISGLTLDAVEMSQDEDVLDTWFSSGLLPFSVLGWPDETVELRTFFPNSLLETGQDILFFWVARMAMLSLQLMGGQLPFDTVLLHGLLRDAHGRKMSKSLGNVIDPLDVVGGVSLQDLHERLESGNLDPKEVDRAKVGQKKDFPNGIAQCGADALRLTLCSYNVKNVDINFNVEHAESKRRFCNKVWQSFKFIFRHLGPDFTAPPSFQLSGHESGTDLWILSRLSHMVQSCDQHFLSYDLHVVCSALQSFWYQDVCDVYLEAVKPVFAGSADVDHQECVRNVLFHCAHTFVRASAPFMPFLCEELYQRLSHKGGEFADSVCIAQYPHPQQYPWLNPDLEASMKSMQEIISHAQKLRKDYNIMASKSELFIQTEDESIRHGVNSHQLCLLALSRSGQVALLSPSQSPPQGCTSSHISPSLSIFVMLKGSVDIGKEVSRLRLREEQLGKSREKLQLKLDKLTGKGKGGSPQAGMVSDKMSKIDGELQQISGMMSNLVSSQGKS